MSNRDRATRTYAATLPIRAPLAWRPALRHIVAASGAEAAAALGPFLAKARGEGAVSLLLLDAAPPAGPTFASAITAPDDAGFEAALRAALTSAPMGTALYAVGPEAFLCETQRIACAAEFPPDAIQTERAGSPARNCQCAHCKTIARGVARRSYVCPACGQTLIVRDHFSTRLGVYQAMAIPPDDPELPALREAAFA